MNSSGSIKHGKQLCRLSLMVGFLLTLRMRKVPSIGNVLRGTAERVPVVLHQN